MHGHHVVGMKSKQERAARRLDRIIDRFAEDVGYLELELVLQERAQILHERWRDQAEGEPLTLDDIDVEGVE